MDLTLSLRISTEASPARRSEEDGPEQRNCHSRRGDGNDGGGIHERDDEVYVGKPL